MSKNIVFGNISTVILIYIKFVSHILFVKLSLYLENLSFYKLSGAEIWGSSSLKILVLCGLNNLKTDLSNTKCMLFTTKKKRGTDTLGNTRKYLKIVFKFMLTLCSDINYCFLGIISKRQFRFI